MQVITLFSLCLTVSLVAGQTPPATTPRPTAALPTPSTPEPTLNRHPILLFPGTSGSQIDAKLDKPEVVHYFCSKKSDWYNIWLNPSLYLPGVVDCFIDNFRLDFNETTGRSQNRPGVQTRVPGFGGTETVEYLGTIKIASGKVLSFHHQRMGVEL